RGSSPWRRGRGGDVASRRASRASRPESPRERFAESDPPVRRRGAASCRRVSKASAPVIPPDLRPPQGDQSMTLRRLGSARSVRGRGTWRVPASALAAVLLASACGKPAPPALPPPEVLVSPVAQRNVPVYSEWVGTIEGYVNATIQPKVQGYLLTQNYKNGSVAKAGDLLFEIDPRQFQAAYDQAAANLAQAQAQLKKTQLDVARYKPLAAEGAVSQQELDDAVQQNDANAAAVEQAKAALENARLNLQWTKVQSPIPGIAGINQAQIGDLVGTTTVLTTVSTVDPIKVQFPIAEQEYLRFAARINRASETGENNGDAPKIELILADGSVYPQSGEIYAVNRQV